MRLITFTEELETGICLTAKVSKELSRKLDEIAFNVGVSKSAVVRTLLRYGIQNYSKQNIVKEK